MTERDQLLNKTNRFIRYVVGQLQTIRCLESASALTLTTLLAIVPFMAVMYTILSSFSTLHDVGDQMQAWLFKHFIPSSGEEIRAYLSDFSNQATNLTAVGVAMLFVTSLMMLFRIEKTFNRIWHVPEPRQGLISFLRYWAVLSLGPLLLGIGFMISSYITSIKLLSETIELMGIQWLLLAMLPLMLTGFAFSLLYIAVPNCKVPIDKGIIGGFGAAVVFELAKKSFSLFIAYFPTYKLVYGAFAVIPLFLIWLYLSWIIVLLGGVFTRALSTYRWQSRSLNIVVATLLVLHCFWVAQRKGQALSDKQLLSLLPQLMQSQWDEVRENLRERQFIQKTEAGDFMLSMSLDTISLFELFKQFGWFYELTDSGTDFEHLFSVNPWLQRLVEGYQIRELSFEKSWNFPVCDLFNGTYDADFNDMADSVVA
ncbi:MAG: YihY family inner membrane protein [Pseudomonadales bacterium]|nr:YihY family inner membrane protein [Pseudomonadales bacterium]